MYRSCQQLSRRLFFFLHVYSFCLYLVFLHGCIKIRLILSVQTCVTQTLESVFQLQKSRCIVCIAASWGAEELFVFTNKGKKKKKSSAIKDRKLSHGVHRKHTVSLLRHSKLTVCWDKRGSRSALWHFQTSYK